MTEAKPDPKPRSSFLPIFLVTVGLVVCLALVGSVVLMRDCAYCLGLAQFTDSEFQLLNGDLNPNPVSYPFEERFDCDECSGTGRMTLFFRYYFDFRYPRGEPEGEERQLRAREIMQSRNPTP